MPDDENNSNEIVYLFSSSQRELYKKDGIDVLCLPQNFIMHFRYEDKYVANSIKNKSIEELKNKDALVVIVNIEEESSKKIPKFYPCRNGKIIDVKIEGNVYHFYFTLGSEWVDYRRDNELKDYNESIVNLNEKPTMSGNQYLAGQFVTFEVLQEDISLSSESGAWAFIIKKIGELETYKSTLFCRIKGIFDIKSDTELPIFKFYNYNTGYKIKSGLKYNIKLVLRIGNKKIVTKDKLMIESDDSFFTPIPDELLLGRVDRQDILLSPKTTFSDSYSKIQFKIKNEENSKNNVEGLSIVIPFKIEYNRIKLWSSFVLFIFGLLLTSGVISSSLNIVDTSDLIVRTIGSILSSFTIFFVYKKLQ